MIKFIPVTVWAIATIKILLELLQDLSFEITDISWHCASRD